MSEDSSPEEGGGEAVAILVDWLKAPGRAFSSLIFGLGVWGLILGIVNITMGAVIAGERKVVWAGMLGGIKLRIGDQLIDGSVQTRLRRLSESIKTQGGTAIRERFESYVEEEDNKQ